MFKRFDTLWINTQGLGVYYLHIRIDTKPKYYEKSELQNLLTNKEVTDLYCKHLIKKSKKSKK